MIDKNDRKEIRKNAFKTFTNKYTDIVFYFVLFMTISIMGTALSYNFATFIGLIITFVCFSKFIIDLKIYRNEEIKAKDVVSVCGEKRVTYFISYILVRLMNLLFVLPFVFLGFVFKYLFKVQIKSIDFGFQPITIKTIDLEVIKNNFKSITILLEEIKNRIIATIVPLVENLIVEVIVFCLVAILIFILIYFFEIFTNFIIYIINDSENPNVKEVFTKAFRITKGNRISYFINLLFFGLLFIVSNFIFVVLSAFCMYNFKISVALLLAILSTFTNVTIWSILRLSKAGFYCKLIEKENE